MNIFRATAVSSFAATTLLMASSASADVQKPYNIYLSMSYVGNDWQTQSQNMIEALAKHSDYKDKVTLKVQVAGPSAPKQIQQINAMVRAKADAIIIYAISNTALNSAIKAACQAGVQVFTYDSPVTEPCAHNITSDNREIGRTGAEWLAKRLNGKGNIIMMNGVPGTSVDSDRTAGAKEVFAKYPEIKIVAESAGMWSQAVTRAELQKILAVHPWEKIDGLWMQTACFQAGALEDEAGIPDDKKRPCAGGGDNGARVQMLPTGSIKGDGAYRPMGIPGISLDAPVYQAALALKTAVKALDGEKIEDDVTVPLSKADSSDIKACVTGTWTEMAAGCNVFPPELVNNPGWFSGIFSQELPEVGLAAALKGEPETN